jgi:hypothetical protein
MCLHLCVIKMTYKIVVVTSVALNMALEFGNFILNVCF